MQTQGISCHDVRPIEQAHLPVDPGLLLCVPDRVLHPQASRQQGGFGIVSSEIVLRGLFVAVSIAVNTTVRACDISADIISQQAIASLSGRFFP